MLLQLMPPFLALLFNTVTHCYILPSNFWVVLSQVRFEHVCDALFGVFPCGQYSLEPLSRVLDYCLLRKYPLQLGLGCADGLECRRPQSSWMFARTPPSSLAWILLCCHSHRSYFALLLVTLFDHPILERLCFNDQIIAPSHLHVYFQVVDADSREGRCQVE